MKRWLCLLLLTVSLPAAAQDARRPNILFLFADDFCHEALGYRGKTDIETPNLDKLAARGLTFPGIFARLARDYAARHGLTAAP